MNDRFKFRGIVKLATQNIVIYSSFLENYDDELVLSVPERYAQQQIKDAGYELTDKDWNEFYSYSDQADYYPNFNFRCELIEQCTGLKDKNGKLIYEGDIILVDDDKCPVEWDSENARYNVVGYGEIAYLNYNDIEVIGNIHENADLLENEE